MPAGRISCQVRRTPRITDLDTHSDWDHAVLEAAFIFLLAATFGLLLTRVSRSTAERVGFYGIPDGRQKQHLRPIPVAGGLALFLAVPAALTVGACLLPEVGEAFAGRAERLFVVSVAAVLLLTVGVTDDLTDLRVRHKLCCQLLAASVLVAGGYRIVEVSAFGVVVPLGDLSVPFTVVWFVFAMNAFNLIDGMDGMLGVTGVTVLLGLAALGAVYGSAATVLVSAAAAGGLVGFLRFNLPPATVYMGNGGSLLVGMIVAVLTLDAAPAGESFPVMPLLALLVLPLLDTSAAIVRRKLTGRPVALGDREHLHHVLQRHGFGVPRVLRLVCGLGAVAAGSAVLAAHWRNDFLAAGCAAGVVAALVASGLFGRTEVTLLRARLGCVTRWPAAVRSVPASSSSGMASPTRGRVT